MVIEYGSAGKKFGILVDGGTTGTAEKVRRVLEGRPDIIWELLVVSHVDHDHIGGVLELLSDSAIAQRFSDIWFNARHHLDALSQEVLTVEEGEALVDLLRDKNLPWNRAFDGGAVRLSEQGAPVSKQLNSGAKLTIVSPGVRQLNTLAALWDREAARLAAKKAATEATNEELRVSAESVPDDLEEMSTEGDGGLEIARLAATKTALDRSATNGSSIAFIFKFLERTILLGGDAHATVLTEAARMLPVDVSAAVDVVKLPHHGSAKNVTNALLKAYPSASYVVSTNGALHDHPDDEAIARVLHAAPLATVFFNYDGPRAQRWLDESKREGRGFKVVIPSGDEGVVVNVLS